MPKNIVALIYAPAYDHRAVGHVKRLIQPIKRRQSCVKEEKSKDFKLPQETHANIYLLKNLQTNINKSHAFWANFGRSRNTPLSNITRITNNKI